MNTNNIKINHSKIGKCYELSLQFVLRHQDWKLVHGYITNRHPPFQTIDHAWCTKGDIVRDEIFENEFSVDVHKVLFNPKVIKEYTFDKMVAMMNKFETYGPWHKIKSPSEKYYDENGNLKDEYNERK